MYASEVTFTVCKHLFFSVVCSMVQKFIQGTQC